jgi:hypothetical protein
MKRRSIRLVGGNKENIKIIKKVKKYNKNKWL